METHETPPRRDPWVVGGAAALALLTLLVLALYRSAPQSVSEASTEGWLAASPNAVAPHLARARERLRYGTEQAALGNDSLALLADSAAAESAWRARELAGGEPERAEATSLWAEAMLARAGLLHRAGRGAGIRPDDNETLRRALAAVERVLEVGPPAALRPRAEALRDTITRELRPGPLEWLPNGR